MFADAATSSTPIGSAGRTPRPRAAIHLVDARCRTRRRRRDPTQPAERRGAIAGRAADAARAEHIEDGRAHESQARSAEPPRGGDRRRGDNGASRKTGRRPADAAPARRTRPRAGKASAPAREARASRSAPQTSPTPRPVERPARAKNASQAKARAKARKAKAPKVVRPPLRIVCSIRLASIDLRPRTLAAKVPFVVLVIGSLGAGLGVTLWLSTASAERSYQLGSARQRTGCCSSRRKRSSATCCEAQSAPALAEAARRQGMIPTRDTAHLVQDPAGNWVVVGTPKPAEGVPPPPLNSKLPDAGAPPPPNSAELPTGSFGPQCTAGGDRSRRASPDPEACCVPPTASTTVGASICRYHPACPSCRTGARAAGRATCAGGRAGAAAAPRLRPPPPCRPPCLRLGPAEAPVAPPPVLPAPATGPAPLAGPEVPPRMQRGAGAAAGSRPTRGRTAPRHTARRADSSASSPVHRPSRRLALPGEPREYRSGSRIGSAGGPGKRRGAFGHEANASKRKLGRPEVKEAEEVQGAGAARGGFRRSLGTGPADPAGRGAGHARRVVRLPAPSGQCGDLPGADGRCRPAVHLQVPQRPGLRAEAAGQLKVTDVEKAVRGSIIDRNNDQLAFTIEARALTFQPQRIRKQLAEAKQKNASAPDPQQRLKDIAKEVAPRLNNKPDKATVLKKLHSDETLRLPGPRR